MFTKKLFAAIAAASIVFSAFAKGRTNQDDGSLVIQMWDPWSGGDGPAMDQIIAQFNDAFRGKYKVIRTIKPDYKNELLAVLGSGGVPDLAGIHIDVFSLYQRTGYLRDISDLLSSAGLKRSDFATNLWDAGTVDGRQYMLPLDTHPLVLFYNTDILEELKLSAEDVENASAEDILDMAKKAKTAGYIGYALNSGGWVPNEFMTFMYQQGRHIFENQNGRYIPSIDTSAGERAAEAIRRFVSAGVSNQAGEDHFNMFRAGQALFITDGTYVLNAFRESRDAGGAKFGVAPMFRVSPDAKEAYWGGSHIFVVFEQDDMSATKQAGVAAFLKYVSENAYIWGAAGQVPAYTPARKHPDYQGSELGPVAQVADSVIPNDSPVASVVYDVLPSYMNQILWEGRDVQQTLERAQDEAKQKAAAILSQLK